LLLRQRQLFPLAGHPVDQVSSRAVFHRNHDRAAAVVVPVQEDVFEGDDAGVVQPLQAGGLEQGLVRIVDRGAPDLLQDNRAAVAPRERCLAKPALGQRPALLDPTIAPLAMARLVLVPRAVPLPQRAAEQHAANGEGAAREVKHQDGRLSHLYPDHASLHVVVH